MYHFDNAIFMNAKKYHVTTQMKLWNHKLFICLKMMLKKIKKAFYQLFYQLAVLQINCLEIGLVKVDKSQWLFSITSHLHKNGRNLYLPS